MRKNIPKTYFKIYIRNLSKREKIFENVDNFKKLEGVGPETPPLLPQAVMWGTTIFLKILNDPKWEPDSRKNLNLKISCQTPFTRRVLEHRAQRTEHFFCRLFFK